MYVKVCVREGVCEDPIEDNMMRIIRIKTPHQAKIKQEERTSREQSSDNVACIMIIQSRQQREQAASMLRTQRRNQTREIKNKIKRERVAMFKSSDT